MYFLVLIFSLSGTIADDPLYKLTSVSTPILREELFEARLYHEEWTTIHYVDMNDLLKDEEQLRAQLWGLVDKCHKNPGCSHRNTLQAMVSRYNRIKDKIDSLTLLSNRRNKRGLINLVGSVSKFLFGTMSADDAENINKQIDEVYNTTSNIARLVKNQTTIIRSSLRQFEHLSEKYNQNMRSLQEIVRNGTSLSLQNTFNDHMMEYISNLEIHFDDLLETVNLILESVNDGKSGIVSPRLVTPKNFMHSLDVLRAQFSYKELPFPIDEHYYIFYMQISRVAILISNGKLIYSIDTPIPTSPLYNVYKFTPIPMSGWTQYYIFDNILPKPIAINIESTEYTIIDETSCRPSKDIKICEITSPIHRLMTEDSCYAHLLKERQDKGCTRKYFSLTSTFILALNNGFSWYSLQNRSMLLLIPYVQSMHA